MCGRYELNATPAELDRHFARVLAPGAAASLPPFTSYNIAPSLRCPVIRYSRRDRANVIELLTWGFEPQWSERSWINARDDRLFSAPTFRDAAAKRRCLVIATGWYEWQARERGKQPFYVHRNTRQLLAFAGVWTAKKNAASEWHLSFAIVTTEASGAFREIHERMPLVMRPGNYAAWVDPETRDARELLVPLSAAELEAHAVSTFVNDPKHDDAECVAELAD
jgi:putative SOS response-associated peptidase YedK